jgi:hypothetical protein
MGSIGYSSSRSPPAWAIDDDEAVREALEDEQLLECIREAIALRQGCVGDLIAPPRLERAA